MNNKNFSNKNSENPFKDRPTSDEIRKSIAPCPKCNSRATTVQNGIFVCHRCGFNGG